MKTQIKGISKRERQTQTIRKQQFAKLRKTANTLKKKFDAMNEEGVKAAGEKGIQEKLNAEKEFFNETHKKAQKIMNDVCWMANQASKYGYEEN